MTGKNSEIKTERRRHPRIKKNLPFKIRDGQFEIITETENISCAGAYCQVNRYLAPMTKLNIIMLLPLPEKRTKVLKRIKCIGIVVRTEQIQENRFNIAIYFNRINQKYKDMIARYVRYHLYAQASPPTN